MTRRAAALPAILSLVLIAALITSCGGGRSVSNINLPRPQKASNGTDQFLVWVNWHDCAGLSNADLKKWKGRGSGGFVCETQYLDGMGGVNASFTGNSHTDLSATQYSIQQALTTSKVAQRARTLGMTMYLAFYLTNLYNSRTPLDGWFDGRGWSRQVIPSVRNLASAARLMGFGGIALDQELYAAGGGWKWDYQDSTRSEGQVRAEAKRRGEQFMRALLTGYPGVSLVVYDSQFPGMIDSSSSDNVQINFWDGITSVEGYHQILLLDATFYKVPSLDGATWDSALQYQYNTLFSVLSRDLSNWGYASSRIFESPFGWINGDVAHEGPYAAVRPPGYVAEQLQAFSRWAMAGTFGIYSYKKLDAFDYGPYVPALREATSTTTADRDPPAVVVQRPTGSRTYQAKGRSSVTISGYATDPFAIRAVYWTSDQSRSGAAQMTWMRESGSADAGWRWKMLWSAKVPLHSGTNTLTFMAVSTKGPTGQASVEVDA